jgi:hypothetical protein
MLEHPVEHGEDPADGLELGVARDVGLDEQLDHGSAGEEQVRHQVQAESLRLA